MADPRAQPVVLVSGHHRHSRPDMINPPDKLRKQSFVQILSFEGSQKPRGFLKQIRVSIIDAAHFFASHRMPSQKAFLRVLAEYFLSALNHSTLRTPNVS